MMELRRPASVTWICFLALVGAIIDISTAWAWWVLMSRRKPASADVSPGTPARRCDERLPGDRHTSPWRLPADLMSDGKRLPSDQARRRLRTICRWILASLTPRGELCTDARWAQRARQ